MAPGMPKNIQNINAVNVVRQNPGHEYIIVDGEPVKDDSKVQDDLFNPYCAGFLEGCGTAGPCPCIFGYHTEEKA